MFKSRFSDKPAPERANLTATYTDKARLAGESITLADLRDLVRATEDWPGSAGVGVYDNYLARYSAYVDSRRVSITVEAEEKQ